LKRTHNTVALGHMIISEKERSKYETVCSGSSSSL
jgi:hypothetical protein